MTNKSRLTVAAVSVLIALAVLASSFPIGTVQAAPTTITAYKSTIPVSVTSAYSASQWTDTATFKESNSGITFAVKQNGTGWLFLMSWQTSAAVCSDSNCFGGIELGPSSNTAAMGSPTLPTLMILASPSFQTSVGHTVDEFVSTGDTTPSTVESSGYATQSVCGALALTGTTYTVQCYRPFTLKNASPYDFPSLGVGSTIEIGFAVGEYNQPGLHAASDMSTYVLTFSSSTYTASTTSSSSSSTTSSSTTSRTTSTTTTTTSSTPSVTTSSSSTTTTASTSSASTSTKSTTSTTTSTTPTSTTSTSPTTSTSTTSTTPASSTTIIITTTFSVPGSSASSSKSSTTSTTTSASPPTTVTTTITGPTTTIVGSASTVTTTEPAVTSTMTSSVTTTSTTIPVWAYGAMIVLLAMGLALGYVVKRPAPK